MTQTYLRPVNGDVSLLVDATAQSETVPLPAGFATQRRFTVRRADASGTFGVTVTVPTGGSIDGVLNATVQITGRGEIMFTALDANAWVSNLPSVTGASIVDGSVDAADLSAAALAAAVAAGSGTYGQLWATPTASTTLTGTLAAWTVTVVDCTAGAGARSLPAANSVVAGVAFVAKKGDTSTNALVVSRAGSDLIYGTGAGATTKTLTLAGEAVEFVSNGVDKWTVRASDTPSGVLATTYAGLARPQSTVAPTVLPRSWDSQWSVYNATPSSIPITRGKSALALAATGRFEICAVGTSLTGGTGATVKTGSWPDRLKAQLVARGYADGGSGLIAGQANGGATTDPRVTLGTGWSVFSASSSPIVQGTSTSGALTIVDTAPSTIVTVWYLDYFTNGASWTIDGAAQTDIPFANAQTIKSVTVSGLSSAAHTVAITPKSGTSGGQPIYIIGVSFKNATGVVIHNLGVGGISTATLASTSPATKGYVIAKAMVPHLTILEAGANDGSPLPGTYSTNMQNMITGLRAVGSEVALWSEPPTNVSTVPHASVVAALYTLADTNNMALIDTDDRMVSWTALAAAGYGYTGDGSTLHLNDAGYADVARQILNGFGF